MSDNGVLVFHDDDLNFTLREVGNDELTLRAQSQMVLQEVETAGDFIIFERPVPQTVEIVPNEDFLLVQEPPQIKSLTTSGDAEVLVITDGGPRGDEGPQGVPGPVDTEYTDEQITLHIQHPTPHPAYDDITDLVVLLENGLT